MQENSTNPPVGNQTDQNAGKQQPVSFSSVETDKVETNKDARMWATFAHLAALAGYPLPAVGWILGPLVVWLIKKDEFPFVNEHGKEAMNFQISMFIYSIVAGLLCFICVGFVLLGAVVVADIVFMILAAIKANQGQHFRYPLTIRLIK
jgi:uncharacterized protein